MQITPEYLTDVRQKAEAQRQRLLSELNQAVGAIAILDAMIERLNQPSEPS